MLGRILVFEDDPGTRALLRLALHSKGYEVFDYSTPKTCALVMEKACHCPRRFACADIVITDMNMPGMSGLDLVRHQKAKGCKTPAQNKAVISANLTPEQTRDCRELGCRYIRKPFHLHQVTDWARDCMKNVPKHRRLTPAEDLWRTAAAVAS